MPRRFKIFGQDVMIGKRLFGVGKDDDYFGFADLYGTDIKNLRRLDTYKGLTYAAINRIADSYASYQPYIERKTGKEWKEIEYHPFLELLKNPKGNTDSAVPVSMFDLLYATASFIELQGNCFWYMPVGVSTGKPREIIILRADKVGQDLDDQGEIKNFYVRRSGGSKVDIPINEMLPFIGFSPKNPYRGVGTSEAADAYIQTDDHATEFTKNFFGNNAGVPGVLTINGDITKPTFRKMTRAWREKYEGVRNAGKVMIIRGADADYKKVGLGLDELDMDALRKMSREDIALMFGVPLPLLGKGEETGLGRANIETLEYIFSKYTIEPKLKRLDSILQFALQRYWKDASLRICHDNIIPEDKEFLEKVKVDGVDKWITRNEIRADEGKEPIDGGDELLAPLSSIPISESGTILPSQAGSSSTSGVKLTIKRTVRVPKKKDNKLDTSGRESFRQKLMKNQLKYERQYTKKFNAVMVKQRKEALKNLEAHGSSLTKDFNQKLFDDGEYDVLIEQAVRPTLLNLGKDQGGLALAFAGDDSEFRMTASFEALLQESTKKMATNFNDETLQALNKTLAEGIQEGEALGDLKNRVADVYDGAEGYRSERVARTETLKASNNATEAAYKQTGYVTGKEWVVNPDACPECEPFDGKIIGLSETFVKQGESYSFTNDKGDEQSKTNEYDDVDNPPLHPNCRCTIVPISDLSAALERQRTENKDLKKYSDELENIIGLKDE